RVGFASRSGLGCGSAHEPIFGGSRDLDAALLSNAEYSALAAAGRISLVDFEIGANPSSAADFHAPTACPTRAEQRAAPASHQGFLASGRIQDAPDYE